MDGSGKSTLVRGLRTFLGKQGYFVPGYNRLSGFKPPMPVWWMDQLSYNPKDQIVVHDRFFYPELVYGPILRGEVSVQDSTISYVQNYIRDNAFLIYCRPSTMNIQLGIQVEKQMEGIADHFEELLLAYDKLMIEEAEHMGGRFAKYDWADDNALLRLVRHLTGYVYQ